MATIIIDGTGCFLKHLKNLLICLKKMVTAKILYHLCMSELKKAFIRYFPYILILSISRPVTNTIPAVDHGTLGGYASVRPFLYFDHFNIFDLYVLRPLYFDSRTSTSLLRTLYFDSLTSTSALLIRRVVQVEVQFWSE